MSTKPITKLQSKKITKNGKTEVIHLEKFTEEQIIALRAQFDELDKDKTGTVGVEELMQFQENIGSSCTRQEIIDGYFQDDDGDLQLTFDEFISRLALRDDAEVDDIVDAFLFFNEGRKHMDMTQLRSICMNLGENKFTEEEFTDLIGLTGHLPSDRLVVEDYVKEWRTKVAN
jgi:Ca2+-binding EF-hand superfamily protein